ncbi:MAG TPA: 2-C-methyl-D-erythritol 2,4-cyclodiphosphate synthase [Acidiferrobacteraceae bacterium]|nr:2-C-methyl-D-erythritol 2,4-cyclodiphosphate synthase [Acidiferrobacteraceae bacterium]
MRIGHGYDVHPLVPGRDLVLGGVTVPHDKGLDGHSDADVLIHAVCDAVLGAAGLGDIGRHFPDTDGRYEGIESRRLLREVKRLLNQEGLEVVNIDSTIVAQAPRLAPFLDQMRAHLAQDLGLLESAVNIKATTTEHLGFCGRGEGIAAHCVVLVHDLQ